MTIINYVAPPVSVTLDIQKIQVSDLMRRFGNMMNDTGKVRWEAQEAIDWFNDGAREIVLRRPAARSVAALIELREGTFQQAPMGTSQMLDVVRNIHANGNPGRAVRITDRQQMDDADPDWHAATPGATIHYMVDERSPTSFHVYPPAIDGALVEALVAKPPPEAATVADAIDLRVEFINAILNWAMYRAHTKDSEYAQGAVAAMHYQAFTDAIGAPGQSAQVNSASANNV